MYRFLYLRRMYTACESPYNFVLLCHKFFYFVYIIVDRFLTYYNNLNVDSFQFSGSKWIFCEIINGTVTDTKSSDHLIIWISTGMIFQFQNMYIYD